MSEHKYPWDDRPVGGIPLRDNIPTPPGFTDEQVAENRRKKERWEGLIQESIEQQIPVVITFEDASRKPAQGVVIRASLSFNGELIVQQEGGNVDGFRIWDIASIEKE